MDNAGKGAKKMTRNQKFRDEMLTAIGWAVEVPRHDNLASVQAALALCDSPDEVARVAADMLDRMADGNLLNSRACARMLAMALRMQVRS